MAYYNVEIVLASAVADAGTFTVDYPAGTTQATFIGANASATGIVIVNDNDKYTEADAEVAFSYGASEVTITNDTGATLAAGSRLLVGLSSVGEGFENTFTQVGPVSDVDDIALSTTNTYTDAAVNTAVNAAIAQVNDLIAQLRTAGIIASS